MGSLRNPDFYRVLICPARVSFGAVYRLGRDFRRFAGRRSSRRPAARCRSASTSWCTRWPT